MVNHMEELVEALQGLKESEIKLLIDARMEEFRKAGEVRLKRSSKNSVSVS